MPKYIDGSAQKHLLVDDVNIEGVTLPYVQTFYGAADCVVVVVGLHGELERGCVCVVGSGPVRGGCVCGGFRAGAWWMCLWWVQGQCVVDVSVSLSVSLCLFIAGEELFQSFREPAAKLHFLPRPCSRRQASQPNGGRARQAACTPA